MKTNHYHMLWSCARVRTCREVMGTQRRAEVVTALCTEEYRKPTSSSEKKKKSKQGQQGTQRHGEEEDCGTSIVLTSTNEAVPRTRLCRTLITKLMADAHCPQRAHSPMGLPRGTQGDELHTGSCGDTKETSDPAPEDRRRLPRKDDTGVPKAIRGKRRKT